MKTVLKTLAVAVISLSFLGTGIAGDKEKMADGTVMMKDGKMMMMKDGKKMEMEKDMTMDNGTKIMKDGSVMMKDGKKMSMKDGDMMMMDGTMKKSEMKEGEKK